MEEVIDIPQLEWVAVLVDHYVGEVVSADEVLVDDFLVFQRSADTAEIGIGRCLVPGEENTVFLHCAQLGKVTKLVVS